MSQIDVVAAKELFELLHEPMIAVEEHIVQKGSPSLEAGKVLDLALQAAITRLDLTLNDETFDHLRWKVVIARSTARTPIEPVASARAERAKVCDRCSRTFLDATGTGWTVTERLCRIGSGAEEPCLLFSSDTSVRRVRHIPPDWRTMTDAELSALSWSR